jgi:eukaryotic-like serine/threonine-protein kinase
MKLAALQAWLGLHEDYAATRRRILANAGATGDAIAAERAAKVCSIFPSANSKELDAAILLARRAVDLGKDSEWLDFFLMVLGMAEYRSGHFAEAEVSLTAAMDRGKGNPHGDGRWTYFVDGTAAFYRAMSLFRQGKNDEARNLAIAAAAKMKPLPADEQNPMAGGADHDDLILWLAYKEAKALIGFEPPPAPTAPGAK